MTQQTTQLTNPTFTAKVELDTPITRKSGDITDITLRKPKAGELRGLNLTDILQMDVNALGKLLPRISQPMLTEAEVQNLDPADLVQLGGEVAGFLVPKRMKDTPAEPSEIYLNA